MTDHKDVTKLALVKRGIRLKNEEGPQQGTRGLMARTDTPRAEITASEPGHALAAR